MQSIIVIVHIVVAVAIIGLVLLQQGKGADAGASFGSGASQTVFGASGTGNFLTRATTIAATIFFITSLSLAIFARENAGRSSTAGLPVVNEELLQQTAPASSDVPQPEPASQQPAAGGDVPAVPPAN
ncbi:MAG: preprotein translocase subunit SecG [Pseudomonadales bacterium]|nr:preprotein translocase subunit SecG [Pseudomonadales bacterium]